MITNWLYAFFVAFIKVIVNHSSKVMEIITFSKDAEENRAQKTQRAKEILL
jgi:hypothetical protein